MKRYWLALAIGIVVSVLGILGMSVFALLTTALCYELTATVKTA